MASLLFVSDNLSYTHALVLQCLALVPTHSAPPNIISLVTLLTPHLVSFLLSSTHSQFLCLIFPIILSDRKRFL